MQTTQFMADRRMSMPGVKLVVIAAVLLAGTAVWILFPIKDWALTFATWILAQGPAGVVLFGIVFVVATVVLAPTWPLTVSAGFIYGFWGFPFVVASATLGATLAFFVARYIARDRVEELIRRRPVLRALDKVVAHDAIKVVGLFRLSPLVPFNLQNYFFGATSAPLSSYLVATFFGIMPGTMVYVYLGTLGQTAASDGLSSEPKMALLAFGFVMTIAVVVVVTLKAKAMLRSMEETRTKSNT